MKKFIKIIVLFACIGIIVFMGFRLLGVSNSNIEDLSDGKSYMISSWESDKSENGCTLALSFYSNNKINIDRTLENSSNAFYDINDFYNLNYKSKLISSDAEYSSKGDSYTSIVPIDCIGVEIDGIIYESIVAKVSIGNSVVNFKYVMADFEHMNNHNISLIDESRKEYKIN